VTQNFLIIKFPPLPMYVGRLALLNCILWIILSYDWKSQFCHPSGEIKFATIQALSCKAYHLSQLSTSRGRFNEYSFLKSFVWHFFIAEVCTKFHFNIAIKIICNDRHNFWNLCCQKAAKIGYLYTYIWTWSIGFTQVIYSLHWFIRSTLCRLRPDDP
jgi:hypothetical protein